ncbi:DUF4417 domain-containing protein [Desulfogranum japonicum]|uniref:DUF4417 domain-containing protein n=1 Tax=Desulfogranum japonicum TaxID=231447 RepID=UPI00048C880B|nr:DUF4417 domain-containing protein [Desulfogranum japonicum]
MAQQYRYNVRSFPKLDVNRTGYPEVYCDPESCDWEKLQWDRFGSGGKATSRHCFVDDWRLEHLWRRKEQGLMKMMCCEAVTSPDFTIDLDFPHPLAQYQVWRSLMLCRYWQDNGIITIPVLQWGAASTWHLCGRHIQQGSVVAVRGPQKGTEGEWLRAALYMLRMIKPSLVLHFGRKMDCWDNVLYFPLRTTK